MRIRRATAADLVGVMALERLGFELDQQWSSRLWGEEFDAHNRLVLLAEHSDLGGSADDSAAMGVASFLIGPVDAELLRIVVHPAVRRQGVARKLLTEGVAAASNAGLARMLLEVQRSNFAARKLYAASGFVQIAERKDYYGAGLAALIMEKVLEEV